MKTLTLILALTSIYAYSQNCDEILKHGIYNTGTRNEARAKSIWMVNHFINQNYSSFAKAKSGTASASIPLEAIMATANLSFNEESFNQFKNYIEQYYEYSDKEQHKVDLYWNNIEPKVIDAWERCISKDGPHMWIEYTDDPRKIYLKSVYSGGGDPPYIQTVSWGTKIKAEQGIFFTSDGEKKPKARLKRDITAQTIHRPTNEPVVINIGLTVGKSYTASLPAIPLDRKNADKKYFERYDTSDSKEGREQSRIFIIENDKDENRYLKIIADFDVTAYKGDPVTYGSKYSAFLELIDNETNKPDTLDSQVDIPFEGVTAGAHLATSRIRFEKDKKVKLRLTYHGTNINASGSKGYRILWKY